MSVRRSVRGKLNLFTTLPTEIFHKILKNLIGVDVFRCRAVCQHWKMVVDSLSDSDWRTICKNGTLAKDYEAAYKKTKTPMLWRDLYKSFHIWPQIKTTTMKTQIVLQSNKEIIKFKVLQNGIISGLLKLSDGLMHTESDSIIYFDLETLQECDRINLDLLVSTYEENEHMIVLVQPYNNKLWVIPKINKKQFYVGEMSMCGYGVLEAFTLIEDRVYFRNTEEIICVSALEEHQGEVIVKTTPLEAFEENHDSFEEIVIGFCKDVETDGTDKHIIMILTDEGNIYRHINKDFETVSKIDHYSDYILEELDEHGFDWTDPLIFSWVTAMYSDYFTFLSKLKHSYVCRHGLIYIITFPRCPSIRIYDDFNVSTVKPIKTIDLDKLFKTEYHYKDIQQIDVVETAYSHKILVLASEQLYAIEFIHTHPSSVGKKGKKRAHPPMKAQQAKKPSLPTFKYMLRSRATAVKKIKTVKGINTKKTRK